MTAVLPRELLTAVADVARRLRPAHAERLAAALAAHDGPADAAAVARVVPAPAFSEQARRLLTAWAGHPSVPGSLLGAAVAAAAYAHEEARREPHVELVVSGPETRHVHPRRTEQVVLQLVGEARHEILLVTYALHMYDGLRDALMAAAARGVAIVVLAEDPADSPGFRGEAARAVAGLRVRRLRWPADQRPSGGAALHAKLVVVDRMSAFLTSANLTRRASGDNLETGLVVRGGDLAERLAQHVAELRRDGVLVDAG